MVNLTFLGGRRSGRFGQCANFLPPLRDKADVFSSRLEAVHDTDLIEHGFSLL